MTGDDRRGDTEALARLSRYGATVLSDAADRIAAGPQSAQWYEEQAAHCRIVAKAFSTRAEYLRRTERSGKDSL